MARSPCSPAPGSTGRTNIAIAKAVTALDARQAYLDGNSAASAPNGIPSSPITHSDGDRRDLRDRALIAVLINTYARITVALKMRVEDLAAQTWLDDAVA
jgi:hypothetical protein